MSPQIKLQDFKTKGVGEKPNNIEKRDYNSIHGGRKDSI